MSVVCQIFDALALGYAEACAARPQIGSAPSSPDARGRAARLAAPALSPQVLLDCQIQSFSHLLAINTARLCLNCRHKSIATAFPVTNSVCCLQCSRLSARFGMMLGKSLPAEPATAASSYQPLSWHACRWQAMLQHSACVTWHLMYRHQCCDWLLANSAGSGGEGAALAARRGSHWHSVPRGACFLLSAPIQMPMSQILYAFHNAHIPSCSAAAAAAYGFTAAACV